MIPFDTPGVTVAPMTLLGDGGEGIGAGHKNTIYFEDARVPADHLVGGENTGRPRKRLYHLAEINERPIVISVVSV